MRPEIFGMQGWYPLESNLLDNMLSDLHLADNVRRYKAKALIAPHAGYRYSLGTAARAYNHVDISDLENVIVCGVSHTAHFGNSAFLTDESSFSTPYGSLSLSREKINYLIKQGNGLFSINNEIHRAEHSLEMHFPLIKKFFNRVSVLPVLLSGDAELNKISDIGKILSNIFDQKTLMIISTDLSHFPLLKNALKIDSSVISSWSTLDPLQVYEEEMKWRDTPLTSCGSCGVNAVCVGFYALKENYPSGLSLVENYYSNSYDINQDSRRVVGYGSAVIC